MLNQWLDDSIIVSCLFQEDTILNIPEKSWEDFENISQNKRIYVFGAGRFAQKYLPEIEKRTEIEAFLDNDIKKADSKVGQYVIKHSSILEQIEDKNDVVVLIMSTIFTQIIYRQLEKMGIKNIFSFFDMERKEPAKIELLNKCREALDNCEIKQNKILVKINPTGKYVCHARAIVDKLLSLDKELEIVWMCNDREGFPEKIRVVENTQKNLLMELADTKIFISNDVLHFGTPKKEEQVFINTWHGSIALKRIGKYLKSERAGELELMHVNSFSRHTDYFISNGKWCSDMYRDTFNYDGNIVEFGSPRLDMLFEESKEAMRNVKAQFDIDENDKIMLYAPTFREGADKDKTGVLKFDAEKVKNALTMRWGGKWHIIAKLHPGLMKKCDTLENMLPGCIVAQSDMNIYELFQLMDLLVTDYSSTMFEAGFLGKKVLLYANDVDDYVNNERGMYFDYYALPYDRADCEEKLIKNILSFDIEEYEKKVREFNEKDLGIIEDGKATERTVGLILDIIEGR